ncbi:hypothetical protein ACQPZF_31640 [Actinosynnema sp. CS-041913]|uniref:hypothetical protein n=1 Tax=Actinosynnema sp. CS-041913 TaxID=3239917 RepID=UPI003D8AA8AE
MGNTRGRIGWAWAVGIGAVLVALLPGVATAAPTASADRSDTIKCHSLEVDGTTVFGYDCGTEQWGVLEGFTLAGSGGRQFRCGEGWAEGSLWVRGDDCERIR